MVATTKVYLFVCFLVLVIAFYFQRVPRDDLDYDRVDFQAVPRNDQDYDYFLLALQWPPSFCNTGKNKCRKNVTDFSYFTIHGLWPQKEGRGIVCTDGRKFDYGKLQKDKNLIKRMKKYWPNLKVINNVLFWDHEWRKHGRCIGWDQKNYFNKAVDVYIRKNISSLVAEFQEHGIHKGGSYTIGKYTEAIQKTLHVIPGFQDNVSDINGPQLLEIRLCVEKTGTNLMDCPPLAFPVWHFQLPHDAGRLI